MLGRLLRDGTEDRIVASVERLDALSAVTLKNWAQTASAASKAWHAAETSVEQVQGAVDDTAAAWQRAAKAAEWAMWAILGLTVLSAGLDVWRAIRDD